MVHHPSIDDSWVQVQYCLDCQELLCLSQIHSNFSVLSGQFLFGSPCKHYAKLFFLIVFSIQVNAKVFWRLNNEFNNFSYATFTCQMQSRCTIGIFSIQVNIEVFWRSDDEISYFCFSFEAANMMLNWKISIRSWGTYRILPKGLAMKFLMPKIQYL